MKFESKSQGLCRMGLYGVDLLKSICILEK
jgi:hypothetical protein